MTIQSYQASLASAFTGSIGINTHLDFTYTTYANTPLVEAAITYLGVRNLRDSPGNGNDVSLWQQVAAATGAKFDAYIGEGSPAGMTSTLGLMVQLAHAGLLNALEGGNEEDDPYAVANGNSLAQAAAFQSQVYATAHSFGLPAINISFGQGWAHSYTGDYGTVGNLAAIADYANAHTYFGTGNPPSGAIAALNADAQLAAAGRPAITTEMGWYTNGDLLDPSSVSATVQAKYMLDGLLDSFAAGNVRTYLYELLDQQNNGGSENNFGLFRSDGSAKPAAMALHTLMTLLADNGTAGAGSLSCALDGMQASDHSLLLEKSDGTFWLAIWNESRLSGPIGPYDIAVPNHSVTVSLASAASILTFDPLTGTAPVQSASAVTSLQISLPDHPILVEIAPGQTPPGSSLANTPFVAPVQQMKAAGPAQDLSVTGPAATVAAPQQTLAIGGIVINDAWAATAPGTMALNLSVAVGTIGMTGASGTHGMSVNGSLATLQADLATLHYTAPDNPGADTLTVNVWNQAGTSVTQSFAIETAVSLTADQADVARLYQAALGRTPDSAGLAYWDAIYAANVGGADKSQGVVHALGQTPAGFNGVLPIAGGFTHSPEFENTYGALDNNAFVTLLYRNALGRAPEAAGLQYWDNLLDSVAYTREMVLVGFAESPENINRCAGWLKAIG